MGLGTLYSVPKTPQALSTWSFSNAAHHRDIIRAIFEQHSVTIPQYVLDPFNPTDPNLMDTWLYQHQDMHNRQNAILGISGFDLNSVDWTDEKDLTRWIAQHGDEHAQAGRILNIG